MEGAENIINTSKITDLVPLVGSKLLKIPIKIVNLFLFAVGGECQNLRNQLSQLFLSRSTSFLECVSVWMGGRVVVVVGGGQQNPSKRTYLENAGPGAARGALNEEATPRANPSLVIVAKLSVYDMRRVSTE